MAAIDGATEGLGRADLGNLVLSRARGESIVIGDAVVVTVVRIAGGNVRLAVRAPKQTPVHRGEVWLANERQKRAEGDTDGHASADDPGL